MTSAIESVQQIVDQSRGQQEEIEKLRLQLEEKEIENRDLRETLKPLEAFQDILDANAAKKYGMITIRDMYLYNKLCGAVRQIYGNFDNRFLTVTVESCLIYCLQVGIWPKVKALIEQRRS